MATQDSKIGLRRNMIWRVLHVPVWLFMRTWIRVNVEGLDKIESSTGGLLLMNHQSFLDPLLVAVRMTRPISYIARDSLFKVPLLGWLMRRTHVIPISRSAARAASIRSSIEKMDKGFLVGIFPEGSRGGDEVSEFRPGAVAIARRCSVPIYPVGISGAHVAMPRGSWFIRPAKVQIVFGDPIAADVKETRDKAEVVEHFHAEVTRCHARAVALREGLKE